VLEFFTDPVLRAPTLGCILMAIAASLVGVIAFIRRRSLVGEALSHATYPGVIIAVLFTTTFALIGAGISALLGLLVINWMVRRLNIRQDSALCFVLAAFFGIGLTIASRVQFTNPVAYRRIEMFLYGQAATMTDFHIYLYAALALLIALSIALFYKEIVVTSFDRDYAVAQGVPLRAVELLTALLLIVAVITGIRSVGVVLMSAMLIAPPAAARQYSNHLPYIFALAAAFGALSGWLGNVLSVATGTPTGPMIVLVASSICLFSLLFAPERGVAYRLVRATHFRYTCVQENILKAMWRCGKSEPIPLGVLAKRQTFRKGYLRFLLGFLERKGWVDQPSPTLFQLTPAGFQRAAYIVRLHRLWEVYLVEHLGYGVERVHRSAEEMEHILTPEIEQALTHILDNPTIDPHEQPIPEVL
jgi:manganese/zinc/iron transport system permease protein